jgi:hypothetical protein
MDSPLTESDYQKFKDDPQLYESQKDQLNAIERAYIEDIDLNTVCNPTHYNTGLINDNYQFVSKRPYMFKQFYLKSKTKYYNDLRYFYDMIGGNIEILDFLKKEESGFKYNINLYRAAAYTKDWIMLEYLSKTDCTKRHTCAIRIAIEHQDIPMIQWLLDHDFPLDDDHYIYTQAAMTLNKDIIELVLKHDFKRENSDPYTSLAKNKRYDLIELFLAKEFKKSNSAIQSAIYNKDLETIKYLLSKGFTWEWLNLYHVVRTQDFEFVKAFSELGAPYCSSALREACATSIDDIFYWIYDIAKKSEHRPIFDGDCYDAAIWNKNFDRFVWMVNNSEDTIICKNKGSERYSYTCKECNRGSIWRLLLDVKYTDEKLLNWCLSNEIGLCYKAPVYAIANERYDLLEYFIEKGCTINLEAILEALRKNNLELGKRLYDIGIKHESVVLSKNLLDELSGTCSLEILEWLLDKKYPYDDNVISTAILYDATIERLNLLKQKGFSFGTKCYLMAGRREKYNDIDEILNWLYDNGCPINKKLNDLLDAYFDPFKDSHVINAIQTFCYKKKVNSDSDSESDTEEDS